MEPLIIEPTANTKLKSALWGMFFIIFGLGLEKGMIRLCTTEGFSIIYAIAILLFALPIWAGFTSLHWSKYSTVLLADDKGIHSFVYSSKFGYSKQEVIISWKTVIAIQQYTNADFDPDNYENTELAIQVKEETDKPSVIWLNDTNISSDTIDDAVSKLNEMWKFYSNVDEETPPSETDDENYTMRQPKYVFWIGVVEAVFFFALMMFFLIIGADDTFMIIVGFTSLGSIGVILAIYAKIWAVTVKKDTFMVYTPFRKPRKFQLSEISKVKQTLQGLVVYVDGKRAFAVDNIVSNFAIFYAQLHEAGKMESTQCRNGF